MRKIEAAELLRPIYFGENSCNDPECENCETTLDALTTAVAEATKKSHEVPF